MSTKRLAEAVVARRNELGMSQEDIPRRGGPSTATVRKVERGGEAQYRPSVLRTLSIALGWSELSALDLLTGVSDSPVVVDGAAGWSDLDPIEVRNARITLGWTKEQAAERAGVAYKTYLRAETGEPIRDLSRVAIVAALEAAKGSASGDEVGFEDLARLVPKLSLPELNRLMDMVRTAIAIREGGVS